jgi:hypothetical protein
MALTQYQINTFNNYCDSASNWIDGHAKHNDSASLRLAAFACGRVVGYAAGLIDITPDMQTRMNALEDRAHQLHVA